MWPLEEQSKVAYFVVFTTGVFEFLKVLYFASYSQSYVLRDLKHRKKNADALNKCKSKGKY